MALTDMLGIDVGTHLDAATRFRLAADAGARLARVRFTLGHEQSLTGVTLDGARDAADAAERERLGLIAVVDGDLTVAPGGGRVFVGDGSAHLAEAWRDELAGNAAALAALIGARVQAWEILPEANAPAPDGLSPERFAALLECVAAAIKGAAPDAVVVAGGLMSDDGDDAVDYLRQVLEHGQWAHGEYPFDVVGIIRRVAPGPGQTEQAVGAALSERTRRLWRVMENAGRAGQAGVSGIYVTGVSWDADVCGEAEQGRNAWSALDALTAEPAVRAVVWSSLADDEGESNGLLRSPTEDPADRRPAWQAFKDFSIYAAQISPAVTDPLSSLADAVPEPDAAPPTASASAAPSSKLASVAASGASPAPGESAGRPTTNTETVGKERSTMDTGRTQVRFTIPTAAEVLADLGVDGALREVVLEAVAAKYGGHEWLPPGEYEVSVDVPRTTAPEPAPFTNQQVISALYRVGGGTWAVLER
ncbi:MAG: hypothetical protein ACK2T6_03680, partial [Anaerolineae bacterium]